MKRSAAASSEPQPTALELLEERLTREQTLNKRIADAQRELESTSLQKDILRRNVQEATNELRGWESRLENDKSNGEPQPWIQEKVDGMRANVDAMNQRFDEMMRHMQDLNTEITRIQKVDLPACMTDTAAEAVIAHQRRVAEAEAVIERIDGFIAAQQAILDSTEIVNLAQYDETLENLRAAHVMGTLANDEAARREAEVRAERDAAREANDLAQTQIENARKAIAGLQRQRHDAEPRVNALKGMTKGVLHHFIESELEQLGEQYKRATQEVIDIFARVVALNNIGCNRCGAGTHLYGWPPTLHFPILRLKAFAQLPETLKAYGVLFNAATASASLWDKATEAERQRIADLGIDL